MSGEKRNSHMWKTIKIKVKPGIMTHSIFFGGISGTREKKGWEHRYLRDLGRYNISHIN